MPVCRQARRVRAFTSVISKALALSTGESLEWHGLGWIEDSSCESFCNIPIQPVVLLAPRYSTFTTTSFIHSCTLLAETVPSSVSIAAVVVLENCSLRLPNQHQVFPRTSTPQLPRVSYLDIQSSPLSSSNLSEPFRPPPSAFKQAVTPRGYSEARSLERLEGPSIAPFARI